VRRLFDEYADGFDSDLVDVAPRTVECAVATGSHGELQVSGAVAHLYGTTTRHDLVVACDVFIDLGNLATVVDGAARMRTAGGVFAFTAEEGHVDAGHDLLPTLHYAHSEAPLREGHGEAIIGLTLHLQRG
jgi:predicted TPR repeat methyltransferase